MMVYDAFAKRVIIVEQISHHVISTPDWFQLAPYLLDSFRLAKTLR